MVNFTAFTLEVRFVRATLNWTFVPFEAEPVQGVFDELSRAFNEAGLVGILDT